MGEKEEIVITKEFLEKMLKEPVERFEASAGSALGDGYMCAMLKSTVWTKADPENPLNIVIKCFPANETRQQFLDQGSLFELEIRYYDTIIPELYKFQEDILSPEEKIQLPFAPYLAGQFYHTSERAALGRKLQPLDNCIILPDLRAKANGPFVHRNKFLGFDLDHHKLVMEGYATLHAVSWAYKCRKGMSLVQAFPFLETNIQEMFKTFVPMYDVTIPAAIELFGDKPRIQEGLRHIQGMCSSVFGLHMGVDLGQDAKGHTKDNVLRVPPEPFPDEEPWEVLIHGDCWSNNVMFRYDEKTGRPVQVIFIDLQTTRETDPLADLVYSTYCNPEPHMRRKHLQSLLHVYYDTFTTICDKFKVPYLPGWSFQEFSRRFRRGSIVGGTLIVNMGMILKPDEEQTNPDEAIKTSGDNSEADTMSKMTDYFQELAKPTSKLLPEVMARMTGVLEDLVEDNVI